MRHQKSNALAFVVMKILRQSRRSANTRNSAEHKRKFNIAPSETKAVSHEFAKEHITGPKQVQMLSVFPDILSIKHEASDESSDRFKVR
jgi:hypothetical protein